MSGPDPEASGGDAPGPDEFDQIAQLYRPLTRGAPEALGLLDDAAVIPQRPGFDLVITKDAVVEGVHVPLGEAPDLIAQKLLRVNLSDLAAKGADPWGYFLAVSWPPTWDWPKRRSFAKGLADAGAAFDLSLLGGDTTSGVDVLTASVTMLGWVEAGRMIRRAGAQPGDVLKVSGSIGDGWLGLMAATGKISDPDGALAQHYRLPQPRVDLRDILLDQASAAADVSDGLIADAGHIAKASGVCVSIDLERLPLSPGAQAWLEAQPDRGAALANLASGGDDYEIVFTAPRRSGQTPELTVIGEVSSGNGVEVRFNGQPVRIAAGGWRHR